MLVCLWSFPEKDCIIKERKLSSKPFHVPNGGRSMKKAALLLGILFLILTFAGGTYVIVHQGEVNAGYAVVPSLWTLLCFGYYRRGKHK